MLGMSRFEYPDQHIESDNRLSWLLGTLERIYGDEPIYVHLTRNREKVIKSYAKRYDRNYIEGIMQGFGHGILQKSQTYKDLELPKLAEMYVNVVTDNIQCFLSDKSKVVRMDVDDPVASVREIWKLGLMQGNLQKATDEWMITHNRS
jgi:hypothetical protein